ALPSDALLVTHLPNIDYLCGFTGSNALLLVESAGATLFTDPRYTLQAREEVTDAKISIAKQGLIEALGNVLACRRRRMRIGFAPTQLTVAQKKTLESLSGNRICWIQASLEVEKLRAIKDAREQALMRGAAALISKVWTEVVAGIKPRTSELAVAAEIEHAMKLQGASGPSFDTIVASGERSALPHARPTPKLLKKNELVVLDQGAILRGYCSDMTRTVFLGRAPARLRSLYQVVLEAKEAATAAIRPGIKAREVDAAARRVLERQKLNRYFTHSTGHGLGIEIHEMPRLGKHEDTLLQEGMALTVEPGVYIQGLGGIRIEDEVLVTAKGAEVLTSASREFLEL
ncbi:MAG: Xaa-Pro peptidase family protein, partial [Candidatus Acidiferrales bacterium]